MENPLLLTVGPSTREKNAEFFDHNKDLDLADFGDHGADGEDLHNSQRIINVLPKEAREGSKAEKAPIIFFEKEGAPKF